MFPAEGFDELNAEYNNVEAKLDTVRKDFYNAFRPEIMVRNVQDWVSFPLHTRSFNWVNFYNKFLLQLPLQTSAHFGVL